MTVQTRRSRRTWLRPRILGLGRRSLGPCRRSLGPWRRCAKAFRERLGGKDDGQIMLLSMAFGVITLVLVLVVAAVSSIYLERKELLALADAMAADAADAVDERAYYNNPLAADAGGESEGNADVGPGADAADRSPATVPAMPAAPAPGVVPLSDASVEHAVREYLAAAPAQVIGEFEDFRVATPTGTPDGTTAVVTLSARARPPMVPWVLLPWAEGFSMEVTARAQAG